MALTYTIGGVNRTTLVKPGTVGVDDELNNRKTAHFTLVDTTGVYRPNVGDPVSETSAGQGGGG